MNNAIVVLMIMVIIPMVCSFIGGYYRHQQFGDVDNKNPRKQSSALADAGARIYAAQLNAWEALIIYTSAILALTVSNVSVSAYASWVWVFLVCRIIHLLSYWLNQDIIRSLAFMAGYGICIYFFILAL